MFNSSTSSPLSKIVDLSLIIILFLDEFSFLNSEISLALSSFSVTKNSAPENTVSFIPKISTGIDG